MKIYINERNRYTKEAVNYCNTLKEVESYEDIIIEASNYPHTYIRYNTPDNRRSKKDFVEAYAVAIDFDNKGHHSESSIEEFVESMVADRFNYILYTSKSHTKEENCFHVVFPFSEPITDIHKFQAIGSFIRQELTANGLLFDKNANQFLGLYPSYNITDEEIDIERFECDYKNDAECLDVIFDSAYMGLRNSVHIQCGDIVVSQAPIDIDDEFRRKTKMDWTLEELPIALRFKMWQFICSDLNNSNKGKYYQDLQRYEWINLGVYLKFHFGVEGLELFQVLSEGHPNDTKASIEKVYESICLEGTYVSVSLLSDILVRNEISVRKCISFYMKQMMMDHKEVCRIDKEIVEQLRECISRKYGIGIEDIRPYQVSQSKYARTQGYEVVLEDGSIVYEKFGKGELKKMYKPESRIDHSIVVGKKVHDYSRLRSMDITRDVMNEIVDEVRKTIDEVSYLSSQNLSGVIRDVLKQYPFTDSYRKKHFSKRRVITELIKRRVLKSRKTLRTRPLPKMKNAIVHYPLFVNLVLV